MSERPAVTVIVPFAGSEGQLERVLQALRTLRVRTGDEIIVADNRPNAAATAVDRQPQPPIGVHAAVGRSAPGFARNAGARLARNEWLLFVDADTLPSATLIDDYFTPRPHEQTALLAGAIVDVASRQTAAARHSAARSHLNQRTTLSREAAPYAQTANCAVRRSAFEAVGGFDEDARAGEDADLCVRLQRAGWQLEERPGASVQHRSRETVRALLAQLARHGSGAAWLNRRYPGTFPPPRPRQLAGRLGRSAAAAVRAVASGDRAAAEGHLLDLAGALAFEGGRLLPNRARVSSQAQRGRREPERMS